MPRLCLCGIFGRSVFLASIVLAVMILPIIASLSREVFLQVPLANQEAALALAGRGVRVSIARLSLSVHDGQADRNGFIPALIALARQKGTSAYIGDGANRWTGVHRLDAARLFRLALESAPAGARLHGVRR